MSTKSNIAVQMPNGIIKAVSCHFDGYFTGVGEALFAKFSTLEDAIKLVVGGELRAITKDTEPEYYKNGYESLTRTYTTIKYYISDACKSNASYFYLFKDGQWYACFSYPTETNMKPLVEILGKVKPSVSSNLVKVYAEEQIKTTQSIIKHCEKRIIDLQLIFTKHNMLKNDNEAYDTFILLEHEIEHLTELQIKLNAYITTFTMN